MTRIDSKSALKIIFYLMAVDGEIADEEMEKFKEIGLSLDRSFQSYSNQLINECDSKIVNGLRQDSLWNVIRKCVQRELNTIEEYYYSSASLETKVLLWNLMVLASADGRYDEMEIKMINYVANLCHIDDSIFQEFDMAIKTIMALDDEIKWLNGSNMSYYEKRAMTIELNQRKDVIFKSARMTMED